MKATTSLLVISLLLMLPRNINAQWTFVHCGPGFYNLDFVNDSTGFVLAIDTAAYQFHILKTVDYGITWDTVYTAWGALELMDISFPSEQVGYVSGGGNIQMLKTIDGGENWVQQDLGEVWEISNLEFQNEMDGYGGATGGYNSFVETHDGGENWEYNLEMGLSDVSIYNECDVSMVYGGGYYSNQDCVPWFNMYANYGSGAFSSIERVSPSVIFMGGLGWDGDVTFNYAVIARSIDNGETWGYKEYPFLGGFYDMQFFGATGYAVTENLLGNPYVDYQTIFLKTTDGGDTWNYQEFANETNCQIGSASRISCVSEQVCYAIGSGGLFRTFNGGGLLHPMPVGISEFTTANDVRIFPNPTTRVLNLESCYKISDVDITDLAGRMVFTTKGNVPQIAINLEHISAGSYLCNIRLANGEVFAQKFIKE